MTSISFRKAPKPIIDLRANRAAFIDNLAKACKVHHPQDWYKITHQQLKELEGGKSFLKHYNGSLSRALADIFPQIDWKVWRFQNNNVPAHFWDDMNNQKKFFDDLEQEMNFQSLEQWYSIKLDDIEQYGGGGLIHKYYGGSIMKALSTIYPDRPWVTWKFRNISQSTLYTDMELTQAAFWENKNNQRQFFDWLASNLGVTKWEDWYQVKMSDVHAIIRNLDLFRRYEYSLIKALLSVYPEHSWEVWKFEKVPKGFWKDISNVRKYFDWLGNQLGIVHVTDWLYVTPETVPRMISVIKDHGGFSNLLKRLYPEFSWDLNQASAGSSLSSTSKTLLKSQRHLTQIVKQLFPNTDIYPDYKHPQLMYSRANRHMQFDIFLPELQIAFEYQGQQHYYWNYLRGDHMDLDAEKKCACKSAGITLIEVPFWWDRSRNSILGTLLKTKPDIASYLSGPLPSSECLRPIPEAPSKRISQSIAERGHKHHRFVPQFMQWHQDADPSSWWVSAIAPGIRLLYDGHKFMTSSCNVVRLPDSVTSQIVKQLPKTELDILLSADNHTMQQLQNAVTSHSDPNLPIDLSDHRNLVFTILDSPAEISLFFEQRMNTILSLLPQPLPQLDDLGIQSLLKPTDSISLNIADGVQIQDTKHFNELVQQAKENNVTGLLLRKSKAGYTSEIGWQYYQLDHAPSPFPSTSQPRYVLSKGNNRGKPKCRGCSKFITSQQPRILVSGSFTPLSSYPFAATYQICLDMECLEKAVTKYSTHKEIGIGATLPPFESRIGVEKQLVDSLPQLEQDHKHIKWTLLK